MVILGSGAASLGADGARRRSRPVSIGVAVVALGAAGLLAGCQTNQPAGGATPAITTTEAGASVSGGAAPRSKDAVSRVRVDPNTPAPPPSSSSSAPRSVDAGPRTAETRTALAATASSDAAGAGQPVRWRQTRHGRCVEPGSIPAAVPVPDCSEAGSTLGALSRIDLPIPGASGVDPTGVAGDLGSLQGQECQLRAQRAAAQNASRAQWAASACLAANDVRAMQTALADLGLYGGSASGRIDDPTFASMRRWGAGQGVAVAPTQGFANAVMADADPGSRRRAAAATRTTTGQTAAAEEERSVADQIGEAADAVDSVSGAVQSVLGSLPIPGF